MKIKFWKKNKKNINGNKLDVIFSKLNMEQQEEFLKIGAKKFSNKFTEVINKLSNE